MKEEEGEGRKEEGGSINNWSQYQETKMQGGGQEEVVWMEMTYSLLEDGKGKERKQAGKLVLDDGKEEREGGKERR